jgi:hypothetical protein
MDTGLCNKATWMNSSLSAGPAGSDRWANFSTLGPFGYIDVDGVVVDPVLIGPGGGPGGWIVVGLGGAAGSVGVSPVAPSTWTLPHRPAAPAGRTGRPHRLDRGGRAR